MSEARAIIQCFECRRLFPVAVAAQVKGCPDCGSRLLPLKPAEDVSITVNWRELVLLCRWAESRIDALPATSGGEAARRGFAAILGRLRPHRPAGSLPLTAQGEKRELMEQPHFPLCSVHVVRYLYGKSPERN